MVDGSLPIDMVKALAVQDGVLKACKEGVQRMVIEVDLQVMYFALQQPTVDISYFGRIITGIIDVARELYCVCFIWVRQSENMVAHRVAHFAIVSSASLFSYSVPESIVNINNTDISGI